MAHFYGTVRGSRGTASRLGTKSSGMETVAASYSGAVAVSLYERNGVTYARIRLTPWRGGGSLVELYDGPVDGSPVPVSKLTGNEE